MDIADQWKHRVLLLGSHQVFSLLSLIYCHHQWAKLENTHCRRKDHRVACLHFSKIGFDRNIKYIIISRQWNSWVQTCKTGDQPHSDTSPNSECSLLYLHLIFGRKPCRYVGPVTEYATYFRPYVHVTCLHWINRLKITSFVFWQLSCNFSRTQHFIRHVL